MTRQADLMKNLLLVHVRIELIAGSNLKYAINADGEMALQRRLSADLAHPFNYGCIPGTKSGDGEELDAFVISSRPLKVAELLSARVIGVLYVRDEMGEDDKIISVDASDKSLSNLSRISEMPTAQSKYLSELIKHNRDGIPGANNAVLGYGGASQAAEILERSIVHE